VLRSFRRGSFALISDRDSGFDVTIRRNIVPNLFSAADFAFTHPSYQPAQHA